MATTSTPTFQLHYRKHKYTPDKIDSALLYDIQNYIPIYTRFFDINETNYNGIQLNQKYYLQNIIQHPRQIMDETMDSTYLLDLTTSTDPVLEHSISSPSASRSPYVSSFAYSSS
jgi:hypothetical protein